MLVVFLKFSVPDSMLKLQDAQLLYFRELFLAWPGIWPNKIKTTIHIANGWVWQILNSRIKVRPPWLYLKVLLTEFCLELWELLVFHLLSAVKCNMVQDMFSSIYKIMVLFISHEYSSYFLPLINFHA